MRKLIILLLVSIWTQTSFTQSFDPSSLFASHEKWKAERFKNLKSPEGYLSLVGLYWLDQGKYTVGSEQNSDLLFPEKAPNNIGIITRDQNQISFLPNKEASIYNEGMLINEKVLLKSDLSEELNKLSHGSLVWYLIERGDKFGIRLKDTLSETRMSLESIPAFDFDHSYRVEANVKWATPNDKLSITNAVGVTSSNPVKGWLEFTLGGQEHRLTGTNGGGDDWFIVFADETTNGETYGGGRFLYVTIPPGTETVILDFNRAENPPCYFTDFATCPLPPDENKLKLPILAGEKSLEH